MGIINNILPQALKPISRDIGFSISSAIYKIKCIGKNPHSTPIFILGNQKSGTSAIAALLGQYTGKKTSIDLFYSGFNYQLFAKWKNKEISTEKFINKNLIEFSNEIIKEPHLSVFYKELKSKYPNSKFVMIIRNPLDNIRSILDRLNIDGNQNQLNIQDKKKIFHSWHLLFNNNWIGGSKTNYIEALAERWNIICNYYLKHKENIILIRYEDFLDNKMKALTSLSEKLELEYVNDIKSNLDKQYQPKGKKQKINLKEFFGDENYQRILSICKKNMGQIGY